MKLSSAGLLVIACSGASVLLAEQACSFSPSLNFADFPLEKGKKWTNSFAVTSATFSSEITEERLVSEVETSNCLQEV